MSREFERLRRYLGDERHEYSGSHQMKRRKALADLDTVGDTLEEYRNRHNPEVCVDVQEYADKLKNVTAALDALREKIGGRGDG